MLVEAYLYDEREKFLPRDRIVTEAAEHTAGHRVGVVLTDAAGRHAVVGRLEHDADALRPQHVLNGIGDLRRHLLLDLEPFGVSFDHACQLGDADDTPGRHIGHPGTADDRCHMMLAVAFGGNSGRRVNCSISPNAEP